MPRAAWSLPWPARAAIAGLGQLEPAEFRPRQVALEVHVDVVVIRPVGAAFKVDAFLV